MEFKGTSAPWVHKNGEIGHSDKQIIKNENHFDWVATVQVSNVPEWEANAQLIAAAPELLEALQQSQKFLVELGTQESGIAYYNSMQAIKKALGSE